MDTFDSIDLLFQHKANPILLIYILKAAVCCDESINSRVNKVKMSKFERFP